MWERMHGWIPLPCKKRTHQLFSWAACKHTCREGKRAKPAVKIPLDSLFLTQTLPPSLVLPPHTHTHHILPPLFLEQPFSFPKQACLLSGQRVSLPSIFLDQSVQVAVSAISYFCPSIQRFPSGLWPPNNPSSPLPLCLNSFGPREQTKKGLCPGRKRWCVTQRGDNASAGSTPSQAPSLSLFVSLISYHQFTFTEAQHTSASNISLLHQHTG